MLDQYTEIAVACAVNKKSVKCIVVLHYNFIKMFVTYTMFVAHTQILHFPRNKQHMNSYKSLHIIAILFTRETSFVDKPRTFTMKS